MKEETKCYCGHTTYCDCDPETFEEVSEKYAEIYRCPATNDNEYCRHDIISAINFGAKWQQEEIGKSEFLQKLRATLSDAEARRLIFETFKKK